MQPHNGTGGRTYSGWRRIPPTDPIPGKAGALVAWAVGAMLEAFCRLQTAQVMPTHAPLATLLVLVHIYSKK